MSRPRGYPSDAYLREARRVRVTLDRTGAFTKGNMSDTNTARITVLAADQPTSWSGGVDYWPTGAPRPSASAARCKAAGTAPTRSAVHPRADPIRLDKDTLQAGPPRQAPNPPATRSGSHNRRRRGARVPGRAQPGGQTAPPPGRPVPGAGSVP